MSAPSDFLVESRVSGLGTVHPLLTLDFFSMWLLPSFQEEDVVIRNGWTVEEECYVEIMSDILRQYVSSSQLHSEQCYEPKISRLRVHNPTGLFAMAQRTLRRNCT